MTIEEVMLMASLASSPPDWVAVRAALTALVAQARDEEAEACADRCKAAFEEMDRRISKGKGTWPTPDYVRDEDWARWIGRRNMAGELETEMRARIASRKVASAGEG